MKYLKAGHATLRPFRPEDEASLVQSASNQLISCNLRNSFPFPYTRKDARDWLALVRSQKVLLNFAITLPLSTVIGGIGLSPGSDIHKQSVELGYWLSEDFWNRGIASAAVKSVTEYALNNLGFIRIFAMVFTKNHASRRVLEKNGYFLEGILRNHATKNGRIIDMALYSFVETDIL